MIPSGNNTLTSPARISIEECAKQCFMASYQAFIMDRNSTMPQRLPCLSFEYVSVLGICIQFKVSTGIGLQHGYHDMKPAAGTSYFELARAPTSLFSQWKRCAFPGEQEYTDVLYNSTLQSCAHACITTPSLGCSTFAYNANRSICATSKYVASSDHRLAQTEVYDYYQYNGNWPCNASLPWKYTPRVIASQGYPYVNNNMGTCHFRLIAAPNDYIRVHVKVFVTNLTSCDGNDDGVYIYDYNVTSSTSQLLARLCNATHSSAPPTITSSSRVVYIRIVQKTRFLITRIVYDFVGASSCLKQKCLNGGTCSRAANGHSCTCLVGFSGEFCEINMDDCASIPCMFNGTCIDGINSFTCKCLPGTSGDHCENYIGDCQSNPCINGTCSPAPYGYQCACVAGFTGRTCEYDIDECYSSPCLYGECVNLINGYKCQCSANYTGNLCEKNKLQSVCTGNTCSFGTCAVNTSGSYCQCFPGFVGTTCAVNFDDCQSSPCVHGSCVDHMNAYHCNCSSGYVGKHCDLYVEDPCKQNICVNGYCSVSNEGFTCVCGDGYHGKLCEIVGKPCDSNPCVNGACVNSESGFNCVCSAEFTGKTCTTYIKTDICDQKPCIHGHCVATTQLAYNYLNTEKLSTNSFLCVCDVGFTGKLCDAEINYCLNADCNHGKCLNLAIGYTCMCDYSYTGDHCNSSVKTCKSSPCMHGVCQKHNRSFKCLCKSGYSGTFCDHQLHKCLPNYCSNEGSCIVVNNTQSCVCKELYSGLRCETWLPVGHSTILNQITTNTLATLNKVTVTPSTRLTSLTTHSALANIYPTCISIITSTEVEHTEPVTYDRVSTTVGSPVPHSGSPSNVSPPISHSRNPSTVGPPIPQPGSPSTVGPPIPQSGSLSTDGPPIPQSGSPPTDSPPSTQSGSPPTVGPPIPQSGSLSTDGPPIPQSGSPPTDSPPSTQSGSPPTVGPPIPQSGSLSTVGPPIPQSGSSSTVGPPIPQSGSPSNVSPLIPQSGSPPTVGTPTTQSGSPSNVSPPMPHSRNPSTVGPPIPQSGSSSTVGTTTTPSASPPTDGPPITQSGSPPTDGPPIPQSGSPSTVGPPITQPGNPSTITNKGMSTQTSSSSTSDIQKSFTTAGLPAFSRSTGSEMKHLPPQSTSIETGSISSQKWVPITVPSTFISTLFTKTYSTHRQITPTTSMPVDLKRTLLPVVQHTDSLSLKSTDKSYVTSKLNSVTSTASTKDEMISTNISPFTTDQVKPKVVPHINHVTPKPTQPQHTTTDMFYISDSSTTNRDRMTTATGPGISMENSSNSTSHVTETDNETITTTRKYTSQNTTTNIATQWTTRQETPWRHSTTELPTEVTVITNEAFSVQTTIVTDVATAVATKERTVIEHSKASPKPHLHTVEPVLHNQHRDCNNSTCGPDNGDTVCDIRSCIFGTCVRIMDRYICKCDAHYSGSDCSVKLETHAMDDVVTIQSVLIGGLVVVLLVVMVVAGICYYRRMRRGSVYISPPFKTRRNEVTATKKRFSSRDIHSELISGRHMNPRAVSSQLYQRKDSISLPVSFPPSPPRSSPPSPRSSSSNTSGASSSANSRGNSYDDVECLEHVTSERESEADGRRSRDLTFHQSGLRTTFETFGHNKTLEEYSVPRRQATEPGSSSGVDGAATHALNATFFKQAESTKPDRRQAAGLNRNQVNVPASSRSGVDGVNRNPFFKQSDGTIGMRLSNTPNSSRSPDEIRSLLDEILEQEEAIPYPHPGFRRSVHLISGTVHGKSDA